MTLAALDAPRIERHLGAAGERTLADDVLDGLTRPFKELPPKHFYDARGSQLFERICELPEYYPTRAERSILETEAPTIIAATRATELVELGAGSAAKTRLLLDAMFDTGSPVRYVPLDVSESAVQASAEALSRCYPGLHLHAVIGDFERHLCRLPGPRGRRLVVFLGGTIGNFLPGSRREFLRKLSEILGSGGHLLLGTDLVKDPAVLEAAYNDGAGVTAEFNRNVLHVVNRELAADFDPSSFEHVAFFDREHEWIEMRLRARSAQTVRIRDLGLTVQFAAGEELRTEISAKFTADRIRADFEASGLERVAHYTDAAERFALTLARAA